MATAYQSPTFQPGGAALAVSTVELAVSCRSLIDADVFSKSDPMCVLSTKKSGQDNWVEYGRTEVIDNNLNPDFVKKFVLDYFFEERQYLKFDIYDIDSNSPDLRQHDFLGKMECSLGEIVASNKLQRPLQGPKTNSGSIIISAEELSACKEEVCMQFEARKLDKKDFFGKSDPFLAIYKVLEDGTYTIVHRTEVIKSNLNPTWKQFTITARALCGGDDNRTLLFKCFDWNRSGKETLIGEFNTNLSSLKQGTSSKNNTWQLTNPEKKKNNSAGIVTLIYFKVQQIFTFIDYIQAGTQLNATIAIDFTASNGNPMQASSLHHINPYAPNHYARALQAVGEIIQDYDSDKLFPVLGFGARLPPVGIVSHEFFVNGDPSSPYCQGISGVMEAYHRCLQTVQLYGPTNFAPVINHVARFASAKRDGSEYFILLILTDGVITDMEQTKEAIVSAASLPLSIIIVGIGNADFEAMHVLDGDEIRLSSRGRIAERDIVQFVPFREFIRGNTPADMQVSQARLAKEVLAEIPDQFTSYMRANGITPGSWRQRGSGNANRNGIAAYPPQRVAPAPNEPPPSYDSLRH